MRRLLAGWLFRCALIRARRPSPAELAGTATIVAPHPDDETLACGGTLAARSAAGAVSRVVVMTDGTASHAAFLSASELARRRRGELEAATGILGLGTDDLSFLNFPDQRLASHESRAIADLVEHFRRRCPQHVFVPYEHDPQVDHLATWRVAWRALEVCGLDGAVWEYPVWAWSRWPWVPLPTASRVDRLRSVRPTLAATVRFLVHFNVAVPIAEHLSVKRRAFEAHTTQVFRPADTPDWPILGQVGEGEFVDNFFRAFELFRVRRTRPARHEAGRPVSSGP